MPQYTAMLPAAFIPMTALLARTWPGMKFMVEVFTGRLIKGARVKKPVVVGDTIVTFKDTAVAVDGIPQFPTNTGNRISPALIAGRFGSFGSRVSRTRQG